MQALMADPSAWEYVSFSENAAEANAPLLFGSGFFEKILLMPNKVLIFSLEGCASKSVSCLF